MYSDKKLLEYFSLKVTKIFIGLIRSPIFLTIDPILFLAFLSGTWANQDLQKPDSH